jgi:hypothetical protein
LLEVLMAREGTTMHEASPALTVRRRRQFWNLA